MEKLKGLINKLSGLLKNYDTLIGTSTLVLLTSGIEQFFDEFAFNCPCTAFEMATFSPFVYSILYLALPASILFVIGLMVSNRLWHHLHGFCSEGIIPCGKYTLYENCTTLFIVCGRALIAALAWIIVALLDGDFVVCMNAKKLSERDESNTTALPEGMSTTAMPERNLTDSTSRMDLWKCYKKNSEEYNALKGESQMYAWFVLLGAVTFYLFVNCCARCCSATPYKKALFNKTFRHVEQECWENATKEMAQEMAAAPVTSFLSKIQTAKPEDWQKISKHDSLVNEKAHSSLHEWYKSPV